MQTLQPVLEKFQWMFPILCLSHCVLKVTLRDSWWRLVLGVPGQAVQLVANIEKSYVRNHCARWMRSLYNSSTMGWEDAPGQSSWNSSDEEEKNQQPPRRLTAEEKKDQRRERADPDYDPSESRSMRKRPAPSPSPAPAKPRVAPQKEKVPTPPPPPP